MDIANCRLNWPMGPFIENQVSISTVQEYESQKYIEEEDDLNI